MSELPSPIEVGNEASESKISPTPYDLLVEIMVDDFNNYEIEQWFNWSKIMDQIREYSALSDDQQLIFFVAVFHSKLYPDVSENMLQKLNEYDEAALQEAIQTGGVIHYHPDKIISEEHRLNPSRIYASFCIWHNPEIAEFASSQFAHKQAIALAASGIYYSEYTVSRFTLKNSDKETILKPYAYKDWPTGES